MRAGSHEVDFVMERAGRVVGVEVKSGRMRSAAGIQAFRQRLRPDQVLLVGTGGIPYERVFAGGRASVFLRRVA